MKRRSSAKRHHEEMMAKFRMPRLDRTRYTDLSSQGLEGPFMFKGGEVLYYDPREGKYYDRDADMYLSDRDADRITSAYRRASIVRVARKYLQAGSGLKAVQSVLPGVSNRQANHFLHALAGYIVDPDDVKTVSLKREEGEIEVIVHSMRHPSDPNYPEEFVDGDNTLKVNQLFEIDLNKLAKLAKIDLSGLNLKDRRAVGDLCDALTKNIENNILKVADDDEKDLMFGEIQHQLEVPEYHEINEISIDSYDFKVLGLEIKGSKLYVRVFVQVDYYILLDFDEQSYNEDMY